MVDRHRRHQVRQAEPLEVLDTDERWHGPGLSQSMQMDQRLELMQRALDELNKPCRDSFLLRKLEGLSHQQIAERLGLTENTVKNYLTNVFDKLQVRRRAQAAALFARERSTTGRTGG